MYIISHIILFLSCSLIVSTLVTLIFNRWQKKHDPQNATYDKKFTKFVVKLLLLGIGCLIVSGTFLLLKMY